MSKWFSRVSDRAAEGELSKREMQVLIGIGLFTKGGQWHTEVGLAAIAAKTCIDRRSLDRVIAGLVQKGFLRTENRHPRPTRYTILLRSEVSAQQPTPEACETGGDVGSSADTVSAAQPTPVSALEPTQSDSLTENPPDARARGAPDGRPRSRSERWSAPQSEEEARQVRVRRRRLARGDNDATWRYRMETFRRKKFWASYWGSRPTPEEVVAWLDAVQPPADAAGRAQQASAEMPRAA